jgi:hypothetical protein
MMFVTPHHSQGVVFYHKENIISKVLPIDTSAPPIFEAKSEASVVGGLNHFRKKLVDWILGVVTDWYNRHKMGFTHLTQKF